jgi:hypothetical protein
MSENPFNSTLNVIYTWTFTITTGINWIYLPQPVTVYRGNFLTMTQNTGRVAIDITGNATYTDLAWQSNIWNRLSSNSNWRFYLFALTNFTSYFTSFNLLHTYKNIGLYNLTIMFASSNKTFTQTVNITDCKD